jgi:rSAM/selenodomain-associated transferase 1
MAGSRCSTHKRRAPHTCAAPFRCRLVIMAKAPVAGRVKTRLAHDLGVAAATRFARHATMGVLARMAHHPAWLTTLAVTPDGGARWRPWPRHVGRVPQGHGGLGVRMQRIMERTAPGPVVIIGTDIPGIRASHIRDAFRLLGRHDAVLGPATDGGYWLVGLRRRPRVPRIFQAVRWSSPHALADTLANLSGLSVARVAVLSDVDTARDFARSAAIAGRRVIGPYTYS